MKIKTLDENVLQTLDFFAQNSPPIVDIQRFKSPFVVGSGNAYNTGAILFSGKNAVLADESNFRLIMEYADKKKSGRRIKRCRSYFCIRG